MVIVVSWEENLLGERGTRLPLNGYLGGYFRGGLNFLKDSGFL